MGACETVRLRGTVRERSHVPGDLGRRGGMGTRTGSTKALEGVAPLERVLVPTDHSTGALAAVRRAALLPLAPRARLLLVHVLPPDPDGDARRRAEQDTRARMEVAAEFLQRRLRAVRRRDVAVDLEMAPGSPFVEIVRRSRATRADLVVMGRHGRRPFRDLFIGSTAERVVRKGDVPVLVVAAAPRGRYRRPLIATDCEDSFARTCEAALRIVGPEAGPVTLFHSFQVPFETRFGRGGSREAVAWQAACRDEAWARLERSRRTWSGTDVRFVPVIRKGDPRATILAEAERRKTDLIALGTHGRSGIAHVLLGSVAEWVIRAARVDVLVARPVHFTFHAP